MLRSTRDAAKVGVAGFGVGTSQWVAIERAVADAREHAKRAGLTGCAVGDVLVGLLGAGSFFARVSYRPQRRPAGGPTGAAGWLPAGSAGGRGPASALR